MRLITGQRDCITIPFLISLIPYSLCLLRTEIVEGQLNQTISLRVNRSLEYIIDYYNDNQTIETINPLRIVVESHDAQSSAPIIVVVREKKDVLSWELPLVLNGGPQIQEYRQTEQTLCYDSIGANVNYSQLYYAAVLRQTQIKTPIQAPYVTISSMSETDVTANITLTTEKQFYIIPSVWYNAVISPSTPRFYYYSFPPFTSAGKNYNMVTLKVNSPSDVCMTVSIQNYSCPVMDLNDDVTFKGSWQTVSRKGGITISKDKMNQGFFVVFVVKGDDYDCSGNKTTSPKRIKEITFTIIPTITYDGYFFAVFVTIGCILIFYIIFGVSLFMCNRRYYVPRTMAHVNSIETPSTNDPSTPDHDTHSLNSEYDTVEEADSHQEMILRRPNIYLSDLARRNQNSLIRQSYSYFWHVLTVALFYFLPVIQLVITYQKVLNDTGNQDLCFYNFYCAHPFGFFSDFNHIFSNIGYVTLGFLFIMITYRREQWHQDSTFDRNYGVPHQYGLFYAIGFALLMEGILSGSYHVCPNHSNFQFDTSFMYVTAVLCMIKIYHTRHPDVNASAYSTFGVLAIAILLGMIGILEANLIFWICFTILHILLCFYLTIKVYYLGCCNFDRGILLRAFRSISQNYGGGFLNVIRPMYKRRMILLLIGNLLNWILAGLGIYYQGDFALYLLGLFMLNTIYYFTFYIVMKFMHNEWVNLRTTIFLIVSLTCAVASMYCFLHKSIAWSETPAQSRTYNQDCLMMDFYDFHDIWHFLSAIGMFFMFMVLLTLDDDISHKPRTEIPVF